jgi:hypothetical protein
VDARGRRDAARQVGFRRGVQALGLGRWRGGEMVHAHMVPPPRIVAANDHRIEFCHNRST